MVTKNCIKCGTPFSYVPSFMNGRELLPHSICPTCVKRATDEGIAREETVKARRREAAWEKLCPPLYRTTDHARIPAPFRNAITSWSYSPRGLGFIGAAGQCKTRSAYALLRRHHEQGRSCEAVSTTAFASLCLRQFSDDRDAKQFASVALSRIRYVDLLLIDDLGKSRMTERCEVEFFDLLEYRTSHLLPTLWTANARGNELLALMSPDRGEPILRRLAEFSEIVTV